MKTLSQRIIDFAHSGEATTATDKDRALADAAPEMLALLKVLSPMLDAVQLNGKCGAFADITGGHMGNILDPAAKARQIIASLSHETPPHRHTMKILPTEDHFIILDKNGNFYAKTYSSLDAKVIASAEDMRKLLSRIEADCDIEKSFSSDVLSAFKEITASMRA